MIYYYSGTGNTRHAAQELARILGDQLHFIPAEGPVPQPAPHEPVGFMFPIYSWGVPPIVMSFIDRLGSEAMRGRYLWAACTCGDEAGIAMRLLARKVMRLRGEGPQAMFSVIMPNDYVLLPGFDVDSPEVTAAKLAAVPARLQEIAKCVSQRNSGVVDVHEGSLPALRTRLVYPLFKRWGVNPRKWSVSDACVSCGKCADACPVHNITIVDGHPQWGKNCLSCCACYHVCPVRAISYGTFIRGKGQYYYR